MALKKIASIDFVPVYVVPVIGGGGGGGTEHVVAKLDRLTFANSDADKLCMPFSAFMSFGKFGRSFDFSRCAVDAGELAFAVIAVDFDLLIANELTSVDCDVC